MDLEAAERLARLEVQMENSEKARSRAHEETSEFRKELRSFMLTQGTTLVEHKHKIGTLERAYARAQALALAAVTSIGGVAVWLAQTFIGGNHNG